MLIRDWMAKDVLNVSENTSLMRTTQLMKEHSIRRLPVVTNGKLTGIITDRDVKDASPSKASSLDIHELYYLLSEMKVKDVMTNNPMTLVDTDSLEKAAQVMLENKISGLPIVDSSDQLIGLLSETDIMQGFVHSTGIKDNTAQYVYDLPDIPGAITDIIKIIRSNNATVANIHISFEDAELESEKRVTFRVAVEGDKDFAPLTEQLSNAYKLICFTKDK